MGVPGGPPGVIGQVDDVEGLTVTTRARFRGSCAVCHLTTVKGDRIERFSGGWGHQECVDAVLAKHRILAGETFRAGAGSSWRRRPARRRDA